MAMAAAKYQQHQQRNGVCIISIESGENISSNIISKTAAAAASI